MSDAPDQEAGHHVGDVDAARRIFAALEAEDDRGNADNDLPVIPGYTVLSRLGQGGGGAVYRGVHEGSARVVAVKLLSRRLGSGSGRAWRELELLSQLHLPCLPKLLDYGEAEGRLFVVTDLVEGLTLDAHCAQRNLDRRQRVEILTRVADAVQMIHERGVIHRDLKPANIMVDVHGDPMLIDFGIAALVADDPKDTLASNGSPIGSPSFMSPEQARGERAVISTRTDVYGLGATAYQILLGRPPFDPDATLHEAIRRIAFEQPRNPRELDATIPRPLAAVLYKAVARNPADRYASASDLASDLQRWLRHEPVDARPPSAFRRVTRWLGRHPVATTLGLCLAMLALSAFGSFALAALLNRRPYRIEFVSDGAGTGHSATLHSLNGREIFTWSPAVRGAEENLLSFRDEHGRHTLAIVGFDDIPENPDWSRKLCAFDVGRSLTQPYWSRSITDDQLPPLPPDTSVLAMHFRVRRLDVQDYFPDRRGLEIGVIFAHGTRSWTVVQIYDLHGDLLYQFWHDGTLGAMGWMPRPGLLLLSGVNSENAPGRESGWASRDAAIPGDGTHPRVLFALRPKEGAIGRTTLVADDVVESEDSEVAWYRCLPRVVIAHDHWGIAQINGLRQPGDRYAEVHLGLGGIDSRAQTSWLVDERGHNVPGTHAPNDSYKALLDTGAIMQDPEFWQLGPLPPLLPSIEHEPTLP